MSAHFTFTSLITLPSISNLSFSNFFIFLTTFLRLASHPSSSSSDSESKSSLNLYICVIYLASDFNFIYLLSSFFRTAITVFSSPLNSQPDSRNALSLSFCFSVRPSSSTTFSSFSSSDFSFVFTAFLFSSFFAFCSFLACYFY